MLSLHARRNILIQKENISLTYVCDKFKNNIWHIEFPLLRIHKAPQYRGRKFDLDDRGYTRWQLQLEWKKWFLNFKYVLHSAINITSARGDAAMSSQLNNLSSGWKYSFCWCFKCKHSVRDGLKNSYEKIYLFQ